MIERHENGEEVNYYYKDAGPNPSHRYLWPVLERVLHENAFTARRAIDVGCGNGSTADLLRRHGFHTIGIDPSERGISIARKAFPGVEFHVGSAYADLAAAHGTFPLVVSLEVIEHLFDPRSFVRTLYNLVDKDGIIVLSTPYHGYWKDLAIAITGRWDRQHNPLWLGGHIKFFTPSNLRQLLMEEGFTQISIERVGRSISALAMSMVAIARK